MQIFQRHITCISQSSGPCAKAPGPLASIYTCYQVINYCNIGKYVWYCVAGSGCVVVVAVTVADSGCVVVVAVASGNDGLGTVVAVALGSAVAVLVGGGAETVGLSGIPVVVAEGWVVAVFVGGSIGAVGLAVVVAVGCVVVVVGDTPGIVAVAVGVGGQSSVVATTQPTRSDSPLVL